MKHFKRNPFVFIVAALVLFVIVVLAWPQSNQTNFPGTGNGGSVGSSGLTSNLIPKATGSNVLGNSSITDNGTQVSTGEPILFTDGTTNGKVLLQSASNLGGLWLGTAAGSPTISNYSLLTNPSGSQGTIINAPSGMTINARINNGTDVFVLSATSVTANVPTISGGTAAGLSGTGACATVSTQAGGAWAGKVTCTGTTGASTLVITPGITAANGWQCDASDTTTANALRQSAFNGTTCTISGTVNANDVLTFKATAF